MLEKSLLLVKPDGVARGLTEEILKRVEEGGLKIEKRKDLVLTQAQAAQLYQPHFGKSFYSGLLKFITSGPVVACIISGENAIVRLRQLMGATDPRQAQAGTIRGDLKEEKVVTEEGIIKNLVHGSDSLESAQRELAIFFHD